MEQCTRQIIGSSIIIGSSSTSIAKPTSAYDAELLRGVSPLLSSSNSITAAASQSSSKAVGESISGAISGAALATVKTAVKFPLDTVAVRLQTQSNTQYDTFKEVAQLFNGCYDGAALSLLFNIPAGAVFFAVKDFTKAILKESTANEPLPKWLTTSIAVAVAQIPYWAVRNPSEVVKVRQQAGVNGYGNGVSAISAIQQTLNTTRSNSATTSSTAATFGINEFYLGYWENILYAYPADVIKFVAYESITSGRKKENLSPLEGAIAGATATAIAQFITTPLDVVRNRLMTKTKTTDTTTIGKQKKKNFSNGTNESSSSLSYLETLQTLAKEEGINGLFAGVTPRVGKAILSGAVQFATYEETKQKITNFVAPTSPK